VSVVLCGGVGRSESAGLGLPTYHCFLVGEPKRFSQKNTV
jgi:hypothetical protein